MELIRRNSIGSQNELAERLRERGMNVTQATLSRDLKALKIIKVANDVGNYMYIMPDSNDLQDSMLASGQHNLNISQQVGFVSIDFSGNMAVIKTRNGYATGLAYDIDVSRTPEVLGTIAGADTLFVLMREGVGRDQAMQVLSRFVPVEQAE